MGTTDALREPLPPRRRRPVGQIHAAIVAIMAEGPSVSKDRRNTQQNYSFRGIDDFYDVLQPLLARHKVHIAPHRVIEDSMYERQSAKGGTIIHVRQRIEFRLYHVDGSWVPAEATGEAMDFGGDKASNKAMSVAMKYALMQTFCIPTGEPNDTEAHPEPEASGWGSKPGPKKRPPASEPKAPPPDEAVDWGKPPPPIEMVDVKARRPGSQLWETTGSAPKLGSGQLARIQILRKELGLDGEDKKQAWREKLFAAYGKTSSSELAATEADDWIAKLEASKRKRESGAQAAT